jgi:hypothetical protein
MYSLHNTVRFNHLMKDYKKFDCSCLASRDPLASRFLSHSIPIFSIHRLAQDGGTAGGITPGYLRNCLAYLYKEGYTQMALEDLIKALLDHTTLPDKAVVFTMDDGYIEQADITAPIFLEYDCPLTFFVITGMLDQSMWPWDAQVSWMINNTRETSLTLDVRDEIIRIDIPHSGGRDMTRRKLRDYIKEMDAEIYRDHGPPGTVHWRIGTCNRPATFSATGLANCPQPGTEGHQICPAFEDPPNPVKTPRHSSKGRDHRLLECFRA